VDEGHVSYSHPDNVLDLELCPVRHSIFSELITVTEFGQGTPSVYI